MEKVEFKTTLITRSRNPAYGDSVPKPSELGCRAYWYIDWIFVPESQRRRGVATKLVTSFCKRIKRPIVVYLLGGKEHHGTSLFPLFKKLGFKTSDKSKIVIDMYRGAR